MPAGAGPYAWLVSAVEKKLDITAAEAGELVTAWLNNHPGGISSQEQAEKAFNQITDNPFVEPEGKAGGGPGGSPGGGSSGGGGPSGPSPESVRNAVNSFLNMVATWGIPPKKLEALITGLVRAGEGSNTILAALRKTKAYARRFPGIMRPNGTMRMTEAQYIANYNAAKDFAASVGRPLSIHAYGLAIKNGNSPSELKDKIQALDILKSNRATFEEFNDFLLARGQIKKPLKRAEALTFIMGEGPREWEMEWDVAYQAAQLAKLEIDVGKPKEGSDISYKGLQKLQGELPPGQEPDYKALADALQALPASELYGYGLTKKKLVELAYGGPGARAIAETATRALAQYRLAVTEPGAQAQFAQSQSGVQVLTGRRPVQVTE